MKRCLDRGDLQLPRDRVQEAVSPSRRLGYVLRGSAAFLTDGGVGAGEPHLARSGIKYHSRVLGMGSNLHFGLVEGVAHFLGAMDDSPTGKMVGCLWGLGEVSGAERQVDNTSSSDGSKKEVTEERCVRYTTPGALQAGISTF